MPQLAIVTGASSGIGLELARICAEKGIDLIIAADEPESENAASDLRQMHSAVEAVQAELATEAGVDRLLEAVGDRDIDYLLANAGCGLGNAFIDRDWGRVRRVIDTNITGTVHLVQAVARRMSSRGVGKILLTGFIAGFLPGTCLAVYIGTKAFIDSFAVAIRHELAETGVAVSVLMPGATGTRFFERAGMLDTKVGQAEKDDPADVARDGFEAMMNGDQQVVSGWKNKLQVAASNVMPAGFVVTHRGGLDPGPDLYKTFRDHENGCIKVALRP